MREAEGTKDKTYLHIYMSSVLIRTNEVGLGVDSENLHYQLHMEEHSRLVCDFTVY